MRRTGIRVLALMLMVMMAFAMMPHVEAHASGYQYTPQTCPTPGHDFAAYILDYDSTCTKDGLEHRFCKLCGAREDHTIAQKPHTWGDYSTRVAATCTTAGYEIRTCKVCATEDPVKKDIAALGHSWGEWALTTAPTCTEKGVETRTCLRCGDKETRPVNELGHNYGPWVTSIAATCTTDGAQTQTCSRCGDVKTQLLPKLGHKFGAWTETKAATCTAAGERQRTCPVDNYVEKETLPALGHKFGAWTQTKAATCTAAGEEQRTCPVDNVVEKRAIPAAGHKFGPWTQTKAPSCDEKGEETRTCSVDNVVEKREIARLKHVPSKMWYALRKPSLTEPGIKYRVCDLCGKRLDSVEYGPEGYRYGLIALNFGPYVKDLKPQELATFADRFTPLDLSQDGETQWPIITQDAYYIGMIKLNVLQDTLTVTYMMNDPATVVTNELLFLRDDAMAVTAADLNDVSTTYKFGEVIPLAGQTDRVLNVRIVANYDRDNKANRPFSDNGLYLDGMTQNAQLLQDMTLKLTAVSAQ